MQKKKREYIIFFCETHIAHHYFNISRKDISIMQDPYQRKLKDI